MTESAYNFDFDDTLPTYRSLYSISKFYSGDPRHKHFFPKENDFKNYCKFDYTLGTNDMDLPTMMQCSRCGIKWQSWRTTHKILDCSNQIFTNEIEVYKNKINMQPKCISDRILLYLRYALDKLLPKTIELKNHPAFINNFENVEDIRNFIMEKYNNFIRGEPEFAGKNPATVAATLIYVCLLVKTGGIMNVSQDIVANTLNVSSQSIRQYWQSFALKMLGENITNQLKLKAKNRVPSKRAKLTNSVI